MRTPLRSLGFHLGALVTLAATASAGRAGYISGGGGLEGLGTFAGTADYVAADAGHATLTISLLNTSPAANGGFLTAFALRDLSGLVTGATVSATNPNFGPIGGPDFHGGIAAPPFGDYDLGASVTDQFLGGGSPVGGIGVGESAAFAFTLTGTGLDGLTLENFLGGPPAAPNPGPPTLVVRFRGFNNGGSDKVPGVLEVVPPSGSGPGGNVPPSGSGPTTPEPASLVLAVFATIGGLGYGWRGRGRRGQSSVAGVCDPGS